MKTMTVLSLLIGTILFSVPSVFAADSCTDCHEDTKRMNNFGYPQFTLTASEVQKQTKMPAPCSGCHGGNPAAPSREEAHKGILTVRAVTRDWQAVTRAEMPAEDVAGWSHLEPRGKDRSKQLGPQVVKKGAFKANRKYRTIIWHDKNPETFAFNPTIAMKTCGVCHRDIVKSFLKSSMGGARGAHTQSQYVYWTGPAGPQSCGLWTGGLAQPGQDTFTDANRELYNKHSTTLVTKKDAYNLQRNCNRCHVGCLDCHYRPQKKDPKDPGKGPHTFAKNPEPLTCYGGGRSFACHAGPLDRRRGDGYIRAELAKASEKGVAILKDAVDVHMGKGISCVKCHVPNGETGYHGDLRRTVDCARCHGKTVKSHTRGPHKNVDCASCHTPLIGGYAFNFWTTIGEGEAKNPLKRIQDYYVDAIPPILVKNPKGVWIPVHVVPHTSGNVKASEVTMSTRLLFRNRPDAAINRRYVSNDSYAITGLVKNLDAKDHDTLVWLNVDRVAHGTGKSRTCEDCHASTAQKVTTGFTFGSYKDVEEGAYTIIADEKGLRVTNFTGEGGGPPSRDLAPFKDKWFLKGDFSLPKIKKKRQYKKLRKKYQSRQFTH